MKKIVVLFFLIIAFLAAQDFFDDSLKQLPPRMRGFGDSEYFETFIKPRQRDSLNVRCVGRGHLVQGLRFMVIPVIISYVLVLDQGGWCLIFQLLQIPFV